MENDVPAAVDRAISVLTLAGLARELGVSYQAVQQYRKNGVPAEHCPTIERLTRAKGKPVTCEQLRPEIDWAVVRSNPVAA